MRPKRASPSASARDAGTDEAIAKMLSQWYGNCAMKTQRLTVADLQTLKTHCATHPEIELRVIVYCPACRGQQGGTRSAITMTAEEKTKRGRKAARARWKKAKKAGKKT